MDYVVLNEKTILKII